MNDAMFMIIDIGNAVKKAMFHIFFTKKLKMPIDKGGVWWYVMYIDVSTL